ncbi:hypothetical protein, partial [Staphylococcus aureus]
AVPENHGRIAAERDFAAVSSEIGLKMEGCRLMRAFSRVLSFIHEDGVFFCGFERRVERIFG